MPIEVVILAIASAVRPSTSLAATYVLLSLPRARALLLAFVVAGFVISSAIGVLVVVGLDGINPPARDSRFAALVNVIAGVASIAFALGVRSRSVHRPSRLERSGRERAWATRIRRRPTLKAAATLGVATHIPGLFYVAALNSIAATTPSLSEAVAGVLAYNAIWFCVPIAALGVVDRPSENIRKTIQRANEWASRREQMLVAAVFATVGVLLLVKGVAELAF